MGHGHYSGPQVICVNQCWLYPAQHKYTPVFFRRAQAAATLTRTVLSATDFEQPVGAAGVLPPAGEAISADISAAHDALCTSTATPRGGASKKPAPRSKRARASSPGSSARSSSWRSTASSATAYSGELRPAGVRAA